MSRQVSRPVVIGPIAGVSPRVSQSVANRVALEALDAEMRTKLRAELANTALQELAALSALEAHLLQIAPLGEARYKSINDAFTLASVNALVRF